jgi:hypothetical protein
LRFIARLLSHRKARRKHAYIMALFAGGRSSHCVSGCNHPTLVLGFPGRRRRFSRRLWARCYTFRQCERRQPADLQLRELLDDSTFRRSKKRV